MRNNRSGALELSVSTIVVIVLSVTLLIMGMVLIRNIMCSSIDLTKGVTDKVQNQIETLFGTQGGEVACLGAGGDAAVLVPGKTNIIYCGIDAPRRSTYKVELTDVLQAPAGTQAARIKSDWVTTTGDTALVSPGDTGGQKFVRIDIPEDAPEGSLVLKVAISKREGDAGTFEPLRTQTLDFNIQRQGFVRATVC